MCTICGHFAHTKIESQDVYDMLVKMEHRGPDVHGTYVDGRIDRRVDLADLNQVLPPSRIALGHSRLALVGPDTIAQPFQSCDGRLALIHNGEIYNYQKLRSLLHNDHHLASRSDSEIIVHLLEETYEGDLLAAVRRVIGILDGMYALAVTDGHQVVVARDPVGKKPVYYIHNDGVTYFASEKKALWNGKEEPTRLLPSTLLHLGPQGPSVADGFPLQLPQIDIVEFDEAVRLYRESIQRAVRKRLTGLEEPNLGVIFSGGVDSVLIAKLLQSEGKRITCYCVGTQDSGDIRSAAAVAKELNLPLKTWILDEDKVLALLPEIIRSVEESGLLQVEVAIPMYLAAKMAKDDEIRVMFSGQAADELFAGYAWYNHVVNLGLLRLHEKLWEDINLLYNDTLEREDKLTMAHSIELRVPYLDVDVIRTAMRISPALKIQHQDDMMRKMVHRQAAFELGVPRDIAFRAKDPAQSGSGIHGLIERSVLKGKTPANELLVEQNRLRDKGSLYRYGGGADEYGEDVVRSYLEGLAHSIRREYVPDFLRQ
ncbi:asparagine synthase [Nitrospira sp.]|nr:asparagine synthase [Nitrospira sp.]